VSARSRLRAAEKALQEPQSALARAEAGLATLESAIEKLSSDAEAARAEIEAIINSGDSASGLADLRKARRRLMAERDDLEAERPVHERIIGEHREREREARVELEQARCGVFSEEAEAIGEEVQTSITEIVEAVAKLEALDQAHRRSSNSIHYQLHSKAGAGSAPPFSAAGLEPRRKVLGELVREFG